jgi:hypothetical protein
MFTNYQDKKTIIMPKQAILNLVEHQTFEVAHVFYE